jgi:DNA polymerase eta
MGTGFRDYRLIPRLLFILRQLGLSFAGLDRLEGGQKGIEGFFKAGGVPSRGTKRERSPSSGPGPSTETHTAKRKDSGPAKIATPEIIELSDESDDEEEGPQAQRLPHFYCVRCSKTIRSEAKLENSDQKSPDDVVDSLRSAHNDWHVARDLYDEDMTEAKTNRGSSTKSSKVKKKVVKKKPEGIRAFFSPKDTTTTSPAKKGKNRHDDL